MTRRDLINVSTGCIRANSAVARRIMTGQQTQHRVLAKGKNNPFRAGEIYWVREPGKVVNFSNDGESLGEYLKVEYAADGYTKIVAPDFAEKWDRYAMGAPDWVIKRQGIPNGVFKEAARVFVRIKRAWREPVQSITEMDADDEGCDFTTNLPGETFREKFQSLFESIYPGAWDRNEDVWVCEFEKLEVKE